jgi:two-component system chemotaxis response regulator CheB
MTGNRIIVIGASAGGVEALKQLVSTLPSDLPAPILIVVHVPSHGISILPTILSRAGKLRAVHPLNIQPLKQGVIYIAPPDKHLLVKGDKLMLTRGPRENGHRPAVDPLFRTAARAYGPRVIGVVLSGALDDGTAGLSVIKERGGTTVVQDPEDAIYHGMPQSAIENVEVDYILPLSEIGSLLAHLAEEKVTEQKPFVSDDLEYETDIAELEMSALEDRDLPGKLSTFVCPECGGTLWEITEGDILRFRCHVGHAYTAETFMAQQTDGLEEALWVALRTLEDNASLARRMAERANSRGLRRAAERYEQQAQNADERVKIIRDVLVNGVLGDKVAVADTDEQVLQAEHSETEKTTDTT